MRRPALAAVVLLGLLVGGCAARNAYRQGNQQARDGNWDMAVARYALAVEKDPENIGYRIALQNAQIEASRYHYTLGRQAIAAEDLPRAAEELEIAIKYDPGNQAAADRLLDVKEMIAEAEAARDERAQLAERQRQAGPRVPLPVLSPASRAPINLRFTDQSLERVFEALARLSGVNILLDPDYRDQTVDVVLNDVTFEEALEQITFVNKLFYKVLNQTTIIIVPETAQKRRTYDENLVQTFYLNNADVNETVALLTKLTGIQKTAGNEALGAITVMGTPDELALAERIIETNDKARGEVMVEVQILEVNRTLLRRYGIELSNYEVGAVFSPTGAEGELAGGFTTVRAHILSSLNLADFVVSLPSGIVTRFLKDSSRVRILATPRLRAADGQKTSLRVGQEVPIPVTTFTATQAGSTTFAPATSFQYRNVGVTLELTPRVSAGGEITLELLAEFSLLGDDRNVGTGENPLVVPTFLTRNVTGTLRLRDGETSLLGGLLQERDNQTLRGILGLDNLPVIGGAFRSTRRERNETEILISITPHVVRAPRVTEEDLESIFVGTRERVIVPGARPPLFGPEDAGEELAEPVPSEPAEGGEAAEPSAAGGETVPSVPEEPAAGAEAVPEADTAAEPGEPLGAPEAPEAAPSSPAAGSPAAGPAGPAAPGATSPAVPDVPTPPSAARGLFRPGELSLTPGQSREVDLVVLAAPEFTEAEIVLAFDHNQVSVESVVPGALLTLSGESIGSESRQRDGEISVRFRHPSGTSGSGAVARVRVRGLVPGTTVLQAAVLNLTGAAGVTAVPVAQGRVVVVGTP